MSDLGPEFLGRKPVFFSGVESRILPIFVAKYKYN